MKITCVEVLIIVALFALIIFGICMPAFRTQRSELVATVTEKIVKQAPGEETQKYLIFTDKEVLEDTDNWFCGKTNSSDVYGQIQIGHTYRFKLIGYRDTFLSAYKNIISIEEVQ